MGVETGKTVTRHDFIGHAEPVSTGQLFLLLVPEEKLPVPAVVTVEIQRPSGTLTHVTKSRFAQTSHLEHETRDVTGPGAPDFEIGLGDQQRIGAQGMQFLFEFVTRVHRFFGDLRPARLTLVHLLLVDQRIDLIAGAITQEIGHGTKVLSQIFGGLEALDPVRWNRWSQSDRDRTVMTLDHLVRKQHRAQNRMNQAQHLEVPAVATGDEGGNDGRLGQFDEPGDIGLPGTVGHHPVAHLEMGDLTGG